MSAYDDLLEDLLVERYDHRWWQHPSLRDNATVCAQRRRQMDAAFRAAEAADGAVVVEMGRSA